MTQIAHAGFLEMPDTSEVPEYERESMLLDLDVPPVRDRDPDPEAGPRLNVKEFRLQGLVEYPELGITREALIKKVESIRFDLMSEGSLTDSGYTLEELGEISDLMASIEKETAGEHVGSLEVQKLVFLIREQRRQRGVTLGMIETVADTITRFYRERGFILAKAYIPQQKVRDGVVILTLLLGELGEVGVENNRRVSKGMIENIFKKDLHKPVTSQKIEEALYLVNDIPGVSAQGFFQPGSQVGDTKLNVNLLSERRFSSNVRIDNHGSKNTGEYRAYGDFSWQNPLGIGDRLQLSLLSSFSPDNTTYGSFRYSTMVLSPRLRASIGGSSNDFVSKNITSDSLSSTSGSTFFSGESLVGDASVSYFFKRSRVRNFSAELKVTDISTELETFFGDAQSGPTIEDDVFNTSLTFNFDVLNERRRQLYIGSFSVVQTDNAPVLSEASGSLGSDEQASATFASFDFSMLSFWKVPLFDSNTRILLKTGGQYAGKAMTNVNQYSLTGPARARGFQVNSAQFDDALYLGVDWILNFPSFGDAQLFGESFNRVFQPYFFVDGGFGVLHPTVNGDAEINGTLANAGVGIKFSHSSLSGSVSFTSDLADDVDFQEETPKSSVYFDLQFSF